MTDTKKFSLLSDVWKPPDNHEFPQHVQCGRHWRFNHVYILPSSTKFYPWLTYSSLFDGVFCLPCVLFGEQFEDGKLRRLYIEPLTCWNGAPKKFKDHNVSMMHRNSSASMQEFISLMKGKRKTIDVVMNETKQLTIQKNRTKLIPILKTVALCARQNISFRGHRDDSKYLQDKSINHGNFQALLNFRVDSGDKVLEEHFENAPRNATYRSKTIQNEMIASCGKYVRNFIITEIKNARFFSLIADEASDSSQTEQLALVLRFIDSKSEIREEFVQFLACESTSAEFLTNKLTDAVQNLSLDMNNVRGQAYDGAGNMAGAKSGVSTRIKGEYPKALYFHCSSHRLNLSVAASITIRGVRNMMDSVKKCSDIFHFSPKKTELLRSIIADEMPEDMRSTLLDPCRTRWLQRIDGLERVEELISPILRTLDMISSNHNGSYGKDARSDAQGVYWTLKSFHFAVHLFVVRNIMAYTLPLTYELQKKNLDVLKVYQAVDNVIQSLQDCRDRIDEKHTEWFDGGVAFAKEKLDTPPSVKRIAGQQTLRENYNTKDPCAFYKLSLTIPFLDRLLIELKTRFTFQQRAPYPRQPVFYYTK